MYRSSISIPAVTKNLLIINILVLFATTALESMHINLDNYLGLFFPTSKWFLPHQFITFMFMHGNFSHLFFNMFALFMFGGVLENVWGRKRFLIYYIVTGIGAGVIHTLVNYIQAYPLLNDLNYSQIQMIVSEGREIMMMGKIYTDPQMASLSMLINIPVVGASGAIFGILLAFGMLFPNRELLLMAIIPIKAKYFVIGYGIIELFFGVARFQGDNIAHFAHLGGMLFGFILIKYWERNRNKFY